MDISTIINNAKADPSVKNAFQRRIKEGDITRDENPQSHICIYFAACSFNQRKVFIGHHIKSRLWLFNGGHIDKGETVEKALYREMREEWGFEQRTKSAFPSFLTTTQIENPEKQTCRTHYDIWYVIPVEMDLFKPAASLLSKEFTEWGWKSIEEANGHMSDISSLRGLQEIDAMF